MTYSKRVRSARSEAMFASIHRTFLEQGYVRLTMGALATACGLTRRALYHHFSSKEEAFRAQLAWQFMKEVDGAVAAASRVLAEGGPAIDAIVEAMDARYGQTERELASGAMGAEYRDHIIQVGDDLVKETTMEFQGRLAHLLNELETRHDLEIKDGVDPESLSELLVTAVCGVNTLASSATAERYRSMCEALLFGCASGSNPANFVSNTIRPAVGIAVE